MILNTTYTYQKIVSDDPLRVYFDHSQIMVMKRWLRDEGKTFVEGQDSLYVLGSKMKYINKDVCNLWKNLDGEPIMMTPGEIARTELERYLGRKTDLPNKRKLDLLDFSVPRYFDGKVRDPAYLYYTDLNGAYWQIWRHLSLDCVWPRGMGEADMFWLGEELAHLKPARNAVAGITRSHQVRMFCRGEYIDNAFYNPWFNPAIWRHLMSALHEIASMALKHNCIYIATDGYLFESMVDWATFNCWLTDNQLTYKTDNGIGYLTGWGSYKVGDKQTKRKRLQPTGINHFNVYNEEGMIKWLKRRRTRHGQ